MATRWQVGDRIRDRYEVRRVMTGGMGVVYQVYDHETRLPLAIKAFQDQVFARDPGIAERFRLEALAWIRLDAHQNLTRAYGIEEVEDKLLVVVEYVPGGDLDRWIKDGRLRGNLERILHFSIQLCDGMIHARAHGIVAHRDLKPKNCLLTEDGILKITDFGLAKVMDDAESGEDGQPRDRSEPRPGDALETALTGVGRTLGTVTHKAPEQFVDARLVDVRADVYSFGVMLYEMLVGQPPFVVNPFDLARRNGLNLTAGSPAERERQLLRLKELLDAEYGRLHRTQLPPSLAGLTEPGAAAVVRTCLAKDPAQRPADFAEVRERLAAIYASLTGRPAPRPIEGAALSSRDLATKATALAYLGQYGDAVHLCESAIQIDERDAYAWNTAGYALMQLGQLEDAIGWYRRALEIDPSLAPAVVNLGLALGQLGRPAEALGFYDRAIALSPGDPTVWINKAVFLGENGRETESLALLDRAERRFPDDTDVLLNRGMLLERIGRLDEAAAFYDRVVALNPNRARAWVGKGSVLAAGGRWPDALDCYERALGLDQNDGYTWWSRGMALEMLGRTEEALESYDRALALAPNPDDTMVVWDAKAGAHLKLGQLSLAIDACDHATALRPDFWPPWKTRGIALVRQNRPREALACFETAWRLGDPSSGQAVANLRRRLGIAPGGGASGRA